MLLYLLLFTLFALFPQPSAVILASIIAPSIALVGVVITINNSSDNNRKSMITSTITKERAAWLNRLRDAFAEFNGCTYRMMRFKTKITAKKTYKSAEFSEIIVTMQKTKSYIELLLNPRETPNKILFNSMEECISQLTATPTKFEFTNTQKELEYVQQVILKSEWKRINKEAEGKKADVKQIYRTVAIAIFSESELKNDILGYTPKRS
ncbi:hypothetical protein JKL50_03760 [Bacillus altitudinis]|uniref:hypothetical protein n=1 Tax=Bacillus altitudinis TaxID=293387 RepID=UPI00192CE2EC|nr:hypothetical protein [Bacillus altitudinis]QQX15243.1 hypothetical protein JKL50_03760 [Bacillus altitudinis]